jgi:hypothetical protein
MERGQGHGALEKDFTSCAAKLHGLPLTSAIPSDHSLTDDFGVTGDFTEVVHQIQIRG